MVIRIMRSRPEFHEMDGQPAVMSRERERQHWDAVAGSLPDFHDAPSTRYYRRCEIALIRREIGSLRGKRVLKLDLWNEALNTRILHWMESEGATVFGLDLSEVVTSRAHRNSQRFGSGAAVLRADIRDLPFPDGSFDFVYTMGTIEHIEEYREAVGEVWRVLRGNGRAIIGVPHKWNVFCRPLMVAVLEAVGKYRYAPEKSFSAGELREVIEGAGLAVTSRTGILSLPGPFRMLDLFCYTRRIPTAGLLPLVIGPFDALETRFRWPGYFGYLIAMVAEKPVRA
jgi:SAM-dependent methyltransferase